MEQMDFSHVSLYCQCSIFKFLQALKRLHVHAGLRNELQISSVTKRPEENHLIWSIWRVFCQLLPLKVRAELCT